MSRPSLREALDQLEKRGLLVYKRGGTMVAQFLAPLSMPLAELFRDKPRVTADYFEYRCFVEAQAANWRRCARPTSTARPFARSSSACSTPMRWKTLKEAQADVDLHVAVYEASHNVVLLHVMRVFAELLREGVFYNRDQLYRRHGTRPTLLEQHLAIADAVLNGDVDRATRVADEHIRYTFNTVEEIRRDEERLEASLRRLERSDLLSSRDARTVVPVRSQ